jgi:hypothetical protein
MIQGNEVNIHHPVALLEQVGDYVLSSLSRSPRKKYSLLSHMFS